jgi:hypothetical protein
MSMTAFAPVSSCVGEELVRAKGDEVVLAYIRVVKVVSCLESNVKRVVSVLA